MNIALIVILLGGLVLVCWSWWFGNRVSAQVQDTTSAMQSLGAEFRAVFNQEQLEMAVHMGKLQQAGHFAEAAMLLERLLPAATDHNSALYVHLLLFKLECLIRQIQIDQAEKICVDYVQENVSNEQKLMMLDAFASYLLYQSSAAHFARAEKLARMGLEIAPGMLTLKGTLGSLLVEQGKYAEGETMLDECLQQSQALNDQAISSFYLGMIKIRTGKTKEGKRLIKWGMRMYPEPSMVDKGNALLRETRTQSLSTKPAK
jgi:tetratricopeptide (TPR) repeat protein